MPTIPTMSSSGPFMPQVSSGPFMPQVSSGPFMPQVSSGPDIPQVSSVSYPLPPGIVNFGNTCFHNASIQLLYRVKELVPFITNPKIINQYTYSLKTPNSSSENNYFRSFIMLLETMQDNASGSTNNIISDPLFKDLIMYNICPILGKSTYTYGQQADAKELITLLLDYMNIDCNSTILNIPLDELCVNSFIQDNGDNIKIQQQQLFFPNDDPRNFIVTTRQHYFCDDKCYNLNYDEHINILEISLRQYPDAVSIPMLLSQYQQIGETLATRNPNNGEMVFSNKISIIPNKYFFLALDLANEFQRKIKHNLILANKDGLINFRYLDNGVEMNKKYELVGYVAHRGVLGGGHYVSYIKYAGTWYKYNDSIRQPAFLLHNEKVWEKTYNDDFTPQVLLYRENIPEDFSTIDLNFIADTLQGYLVTKNEL